MARPGIDVLRGLRQYGALRDQVHVNIVVRPPLNVEQVTNDFSEEEYVALQRWVHRVGVALGRSVPTERVYVLSLGSQQGNRHVHWHVVAQPPGLAYGDQQLALLAKSVRGVLPFTLERNKALANEFAPS
jgi:hypothetical protein